MKGLEACEMQRYKKMTVNPLSTQPAVPYLSSDVPNVSLVYPQKIKLVNCATYQFLQEFVLSFQTCKYIPSKPPIFMPDDTTNMKSELKSVTSEQEGPGLNTAEELRLK